MSTERVKVFRCKNCATVIRRAEARQEHNYWHHISDKNVDAYFTEEEEVLEVGTLDGGGAMATAVAPARAYGVLLVSAAILGAMLVLYVATK